MEIIDLRPVTGWRVAVAGRYGGDRIVHNVLPMIGWARQDIDMGGATAWLPCWWDELGVTTGSPYEVGWPLAPGEDDDDDLWAALNEQLPKPRDDRAAYTRGGDDAEA